MLTQEFYLYQKVGRYTAAGGAFMGKTIVEAKDILESILQNNSQWHTERAPMPSKK
jgi:hypothetical protein